MVPSSAAFASAAALSSAATNSAGVANGGGELVLLLAAASLALALAGPGRYSVWRDNPIADRGVS